MGMFEASILALRGRSNLLNLRRFSLYISLFAAVGIIAMACSSSNSSDTANEGDRLELSSLGRLPGQFPPTPDAAPEGGLEAPVGACVSVTGPREHAGLKTVRCGSRDNNYVVIQRVRWPAECVADSDRKYYRNGIDGEWTACLDLAWASSDCLALSPDDAQRVDCADPTAKEKEKPTEIFIDTVNAAQCDSGGYAHPVRRFTVCTEMQR